MYNPHAQSRSVFKQKGKWLVWSILNPLAFYFLVFSPFSSFNSVFAQQPKWKWPESFTVGTPGIGSASQLQTASWVPVLDKMTGMKVRVMPEHSASQRLRWLRTGVTDAETDGLPAFVSEGMEARDAYATREGGPFQARVLWACQNMDYGYMVRGDSDIKTIYDLKRGKRKFAICTAIPGAMRSIDALLAWLELRKEDVILVPFNNWKSNILSVVERKADVALVTITAAAVTEAVASAAGVRVLPLPYKEDREGAKRFFNTRPTIIFRSIKDGSKDFIGIPSFAFDFFYQNVPEYPPALLGGMNGLPSPLGGEG